MTPDWTPTDSPTHPPPVGVPVYVWPPGYSGIGRCYAGEWLAGAYESTPLDPAPTHYRLIVGPDRP